MAIWKRTMDFLGLGPDEAYDDYDAPAEPERPRSRQREPEPRRDQRSAYPDEYDSSVRTLPSRPSFPTREPDLTGRRPMPPADDSAVQPRPVNQQRSTHRQSGSSVSTVDPYTVRPRRFDSAQEVADKFKEGQAVIMNLEGADREVSRRLIDFASGLCYGLNGSMEKVASGVYLLKPVSSRSGYEDDFDS
jgi:cell division inhibitor SepF